VRGRVAERVSLTRRQRITVFVFFLHAQRHS